LPETDMPAPEEVGANIKPEKSDEALSESDDDHETSNPHENPPGQSEPVIQSSGSTPVLRMTLRSSTWRRLLLRDAIVPTLPTPLGRDDAMVDLSSRVLAEKQGSIPRTLQYARIVTGVRIEFPAPLAGASPRWAVVSGAAPLIANADERAAEIGWSEGVSSGQYVLLAADGHSIASISSGPESEISLSSADEISSWPWVGIECGSSEAERFDWQVIGTAPMPSSWTKHRQWLHVQGRRLDLRSLSERDETITQSLAIVDALTGWARVSKIEYQQKIRR
jgi:hypothetical protein